MEIKNSSTLSGNQLAAYIKLLRNTLVWLDENYFTNIIFLNDRCLYAHIRRIPLPNVNSQKATSKDGRPTAFAASCRARRAENKMPADIGELLDILEPYIPFRLSEENFDVFMDTVYQAQGEADELACAFADKAKQDFVVKLRGIADPAEWRQLLTVCESIRIMREELAEVLV